MGPFKLPYPHIRKLQDALFEVTSFYVPVDDMEIFKATYHRFRWYVDFRLIHSHEHTSTFYSILTSNSRPKNPKDLMIKAGDFSPAPMTRWRGGWEEGSFNRNGQDMARFTSVIRWYPGNEASRWYGEYAERICKNDYERMGLELDALTLIAQGGVETRILYVMP